MYTREVLKAKTLKDLRAICKGKCHKYRGYSKHTKKEDLINFMLAQGKKKATPKKATPKKAAPKKAAPKKAAPKKAAPKKAAPKKAAPKKAAPKRK